jgi:hypothetical protein
MFMCFENQWVVINWNLTWKQSFLILVDSETLWMMLPVPLRIDITLKRPRTFTLLYQDLHSENYFHYKLQ